MTHNAIFVNVKLMEPFHNLSRLYGPGVLKFCKLKSLGNLLSQVHEVGWLHLNNNNAYLTHGHTLAFRVDCSNALQSIKASLQARGSHDHNCINGFHLEVQKGTL